MTTAQLTKSDPTAHLSDEDIENLGRELDAIGEQIIASRGERDAAYIRQVIAGQRTDQDEFRRQGKRCSSRSAGT